VFDVVEILNVPSIPLADPADVVPPELKVNPDPSDVGNVMTIFPSAARLFAVVNKTVTLPDALAASEAGSTFVEVRFPIIVSTDTDVSWSITVSEESRV